MRPPVEHHLQAGGIFEGDWIGLRRRARRDAVGDQAVEREAARLDQPHDLGEVALAPLRGDAEARLAHEGGREGEAHPVVEAGEHDLAARREALNERIERRGVAADVDDRADRSSADLRCGVVTT